MQKRVCSFFQAQKYASRVGLQLPVQFVGQSLLEVLKYADRVGYPVVLKVLSADIVHKTDAKAVAADIRSSQELSRVYEELLQNVRSYKRDVKIDGVLVQSYVPSEVQVIVGGRRDPSFGPVVLVGSGGIFAEVMGDSSVRVFPISRDEVLEMLDELKIKKLFSGFRGIKVDTKGVVDAVLKVGKLLEEHEEIQEVDINPLVVSGKHAFAVDVRIVVEE